MPPVSNISQLSPEQIAMLDQKLIEQRFSDYRGLEAWANENGLQLNRSSLSKYGQKLSAQLEELKIAQTFAKMYAEEMPDDAGLKSQMLNGLAQDVLYRVITQLNIRVQSIDDNSDLWSLLRQLAMVTKSISDVSRVDLAVQKYAAEVRAKQESELDRLAEDGKKRGIDAKFIQDIKTKVLGIAA